ncbi:MAG: amino acid adenylation domain-containing protein [Sulfuritalea sp.]|nr:amino acid adenylation domain-containing protein [Sulfuritalea sp.]
MNPQSRYLTDLGTAFRAVAAHRADAVALRLPDGASCSYRRLLETSGNIARQLRSAGVRRGDVVGLFHAKQVEGYAAMLACLDIGAPYVNLDEDNPPQRLGSILAACNPVLVLADGIVSPAALDTCAHHGVDLRMLLSPWPDMDASVPARVDIDTAVIGTDIAYLMFTSGSTGTPKGVAISHSQVLNFVAWARADLAIGGDDVLSNVNPMYFDNSVFDFYAALFNGAALAPISRSSLRDARLLVRQVRDAGCTIWFSVPSLLIYLMTTRSLARDSWPAVRAVVFGGEGYPKPELRKLFDLLGERTRLVNVYGPTECTCICSAYDVGAGDFMDMAGYPPIGRLAPNFRGLLLAGDVPVPPGDVGELCLLGPNVGLGYYQDPQRTARSFVANPCCGSHREPMYRTGDLMRLDPVDMRLHFVGRIDNQIKHMGYRIELEEIESALALLPGVVQCAVIYKRVRSQFGNLIAYVAGSAPALDAETLLDQLRSRLPSYMIPNHLEIRSELPKNPNGKVDRKRLADDV